MEVAAFITLGHCTRKLQCSTAVYDDRAGGGLGPGGWGRCVSVCQSLGPATCC